MLPSKATQRKIWQRVYAAPTGHRIPRQPMLACRRRCEENLRVFSRFQSDPVYGPAFQQLAALTRQQLAMLDAILSR